MNYFCHLLTVKFLNNAMKTFLNQLKYFIACFITAAMITAIMLWLSSQNGFDPLVEHGWESNSDKPSTESVDNLGSTHYSRPNIETIGSSERVSEGYEKNQEWINEFPWEPVVDEDFPYIPHVFVEDYKCTNSVEETLIFEQKENYTHLKQLFSNEVRYSTQFESMYYILSKYERNYDPVLAKEIFELLWNYHKYKDHDDIKAMEYARGIVAALTDPRNGIIFLMTEGGRPKRLCKIYY